jgi:hypothetical protein
MSPQVANAPAVFYFPQCVPGQSVKNPENL